MEQIPLGSLATAIADFRGTSEDELSFPVEAKLSNVVSSLANPIMTSEIMTSHL